MNKVIEFLKPTTITDLDGNTTVIEPITLERILHDNEKAVRADASKLAFIQAAKQIKHQYSTGLWSIDKDGNLRCTLTVDYTWKLMPASNWYEVISIPLKAMFEQSRSLKAMKKVVAAAKSLHENTYEYDPFVPAIIAQFALIMGAVDFAMHRIEIIKTNHLMRERGVLTKLKPTPTEWIHELNGNDSAHTSGTGTALAALGWVN